MFIDKVEVAKPPASNFGDSRGESVFARDKLIANNFCHKDFRQKGSLAKRIFGKIHYKLAIRIQLYFKVFLYFKCFFINASMSTTMSSMNGKRFQQPCFPSL